MSRSRALRAAIIGMFLLAAAGIAPQPSATAVCQSGQLVLGPVIRVSPEASWVGRPSLISDSTGRLSAAFNVQRETPNGNEQTLWSGDVPQAADDPQLIRASEDDWPAMGSEDGSRDLGIDAGGTQTVAWKEEQVALSEEVGETWNVWVATRPSDGEWSSPTKVNTIGGILSDVHLAVNGSGAAVVVWRRGLNELFAAYRPSADAAWLPAQRLAAGGGYHHQVGIDDAGNATVLYNGSSGGSVRVRRLEPATGWGAARVISGGRVATTSNLAVSSNGSATATWEEKLAGSDASGHFTRRMTATGDWLPIVRRRGGGIVFPGGLATDGNGVAIVAWKSRTREVVAQFSRADGSWRRPVVLSGPQQSPPWFPLKVAMNAHGDSLVLWKVGGDGDPRLRGRYRPTGQPWAPVQRLTPIGVNPDIYTSTVAPNGDAGIAWSRVRSVQARQLQACP